MSRAIQIVHADVFTKADRLKLRFRALSAHGMMRGTGGLYDLHGDELKPFLISQQISVSSKLQCSAAIKHQNITART